MDIMVSIQIAQLKSLCSNCFGLHYLCLFNGYKGLKGVGHIFYL